MARRASRDLKPAVSRLEAREVLSRVGLSAHGVASLASHRAAPLVVAAPSGQVTPAAQPAGTPAPTPQELAREQYLARVTRIQVGQGAPRFTDQKAQFLYAGSGVSNQAIAIRLVMRLYIPTDPAQPITGIASLRSRDVATTGTNLILDLTGSSADVDARGRPTRLTWTVDGNAGGSYAGATEVNPDGTPGTGTLDLIYAPNPNHAPHGTGINAGSATALFKGLIRTNNGVTQVTAFELGHF